MSRKNAFIAVLNDRIKEWLRASDYEGGMSRSKYSRGLTIQLDTKGLMKNGINKKILKDIIENRIAYKVLKYEINKKENDPTLRSLTLYFINLN
jgi:hypothetical protein